MGVLQAARGSVSNTNRIKRLHDMSHRIWAATAALLAFGAATARAQSSSTIDVLGRLDETGPLVRNCGTPHAEPADLERVERARGQFRAERLSIASGGTIKVAFHVITSNHLGEVTDGQIAEQIA